ncbi:MAG: TlpA family protein disulfide reductase [Polyangiaceae bacterium]|nr:TlpA family protein disulfide reductase [Polyangiaceae bacterium]
MTRPPLAALSALLAALALAPLPACGGAGALGAGADSTEEHPLVGVQAPDFELPLESGGSGSVTLSALSGKVVLVDFWATWCKPCKASFPEYQRLQAQHPEDFVVVAVSVDEQREGIAGFARDTGAKFLVAWDDGQAVSKAWSPATMPTAYLIDRAGVVRHVHAGFRDGDAAKIAARVDALLAE